MTEGRQTFTAEIKTLAKGPSTYDPLENNIRKKRAIADGDAKGSNQPFCRPSVIRPGRQLGAQHRTLLAQQVGRQNVSRDLAIPKAHGTRRDLSSPKGHGRSRPVPRRPEKSLILQSSPVIALPGV
jgi:hypothetical protein